MIYITVLRISHVHRFTYTDKGKTFPVLNYLSTTPLRRKGSGGTASHFTAALDGGVGQLQALAALLSGKEPMKPIGLEAEWTPK
jgi:hypothetical protein